jgi:hypothetical protein
VRSPHTLGNTGGDQEVWGGAGKYRLGRGRNVGDGEQVGGYPFGIIWVVMVQQNPVGYNTLEEIGRFGEVLGRITAGVA